MKTKGSRMRKFVKVLGFLVAIFLFLSLDSFAAEKMWKGLAPVVQPDGSIKLVDKPIPSSRVNPKVIPEGAVGYWGYPDEMIAVNMPPQVDTKNWKAGDYMSTWETFIGMANPPMKDVYIPYLGYDLIDKSGRTRIRRAENWKKPYYGKEGIWYKSMWYFHLPQEVSGMSIFIVKHTDKSIADDEWLYLPALRKIRRIPAAQKIDSFAGSDFTNNDIDLSTAAWNYEIIREEVIDANKSPFKEAYGIEHHRHIINGRRCVVIKGVPKDKDWPVGYELYWQDKEKAVGRYQEAYDKGGRKIKTVLHYIDHGVPKNPKYVTFADHYAANLLTGHKTYLFLGELDEKGNTVPDFSKRDWSNYIHWVDTGYSDEFVSLRFMERGVR